MKSFILLIFLVSQTAISASQSNYGVQRDTVYNSAQLIVVQLSPNAYVHVSFFESQSFGKVTCNGMIVKGGSEVLVFDTPAGDSSSAELIKWLKQQKLRVKAIVPTHFHEDCLGGLKTFHHHNVPSYAHRLTIKLARAKGFATPQHAFDKYLTLFAGSNKVDIKFFGQGHTKDNIVVWFPLEKVLFGGCLVKELHAGKGNLADANIVEWASTVRRVTATYPAVQVVIPGHGKVGDKSLLDYTTRLFSLH